MVKNYAKAGFPVVPQTREEEVQRLPEREQGSAEQQEEKAPAAEVSRLKGAMAEPPGAEPDVEIEATIL